MNKEYAYTGGLHIGNTVKMIFTNSVIVRDSEEAITLTVVNYDNYMIAYTGIYSNICKMEVQSGPEDSDELDFHVGWIQDFLDNGRTALTNEEEKIVWAFLCDNFLKI